MTTDALLHWLARTSLEASLLILAVLGLRLMLGTRLSPAWRIGLWMLVGMKLMLPAFIPAGFGIGGWFQPDATAPRSASMALAYSPDLPSAAQSTKPAISTTAPIQEMASGLPTHSRSSISLTQILLAAWLTGAIAVLGVAIIRQHRFATFLRRRPRATSPYLRALVASMAHKAGLKQSVSIILMPPGTTPAMVGLSHPKILFPEDWESRFDERSLRHVLLHELLHVKQHDLLWNWAATAVQALHWFNPLVWFVVSRFQADRELRCDAGALALLAPSERLDYGHTLLRIQETFFAPPTIAGLAPCVRHHPTLRQRILMIATPTTRQPLLQALLVLTLSGLVCYSFTTARAAEKEVPPKVREGESIQKPGQRESDAGTPARTGDREGDGARKPGMRDGDGGSKTGARDGDKPRTGEREGDGARKPGMREGDGSRKPGARDGDRAPSSSETLTLNVIKNGEAVMVGDEEVAMNRLRGHLSTFLPNHPGARIEVTGDDDIPLKTLHNTVDAVRDNGNKNVGIKSE